MPSERVKNALIMAAGLGTRLEPLTLAVPKPMVPIVGKPTMQHNLELLRKHGIRRATVNIHYHPEQVVNFFSDGDAFGMDLAYSYEEKLLGTAGGVLRMAEVAGGLDDTFVVLSSDALTDIDLRKLVAFHKKKGALATLALAPMQETEHFGVVDLDKDQRITAFFEKPKSGEAPSNLVNTGIYVFEPEILESIPQDRFFDFGKELFPRLAKEGAPLFGYKMIEYWSDVGNLKTYVKTNYDAMQGRVRIMVPGRKTSACVWIGKNCEIDPTVKFEGCVIVGDKCEIRKGAHLKDTVLGNMSVVSHNARLEGSIIWSDTFISQNAKIKGSVIGSWCRVGEGVTIEEDTVLSNRCAVLKGTHIFSNTHLKPNEVL